MSMSAGALPLGIAVWMLSTPAVSALSDVSELPVFVARHPYAIIVEGERRIISLGGRDRAFDLLGGIDSGNPKTGIVNAATVQAWSAQQGREVLLSGSRGGTGFIPGRIERVGTRLVIRTAPGDGAVAGKCRAQMSSYPVSAQRTFVWDLKVQLGSPEPGDEWVLTSPGRSPVLIWQLKAPDLQPALAVVVDTDPTDTSKLLLFFSRKTGGERRPSRVGQIHGIERHRLLNIVMTAHLEEDDAAGKGSWRAWVNGVKVVDRSGATLSSGAKQPHQWFIGTYMYNDTCPTTLGRATFWERARMLRPKG